MRVITCGIIDSLALKKIAHRFGDAIHFYFESDILSHYFCEIFERNLRVLVFAFRQYVYKGREVTLNFWVATCRHL